ncbi:ATP synthase subunit I [Candidatus Entotheonella palauensis]|uniref:ATP synthase subunit I n=1 Tax=Candidatus Entotheonella gemina TaxID=1429439 RepID=W4LRJ7_9BACT|nr:ATP synthase subunit I [Candidatus Entotheonella palauensis]ETX00017.1 MAG: hypothetical protein ETSY2_39880 [Candidatus Entotheonella gemina]
MEGQRLALEMAFGIGIGLGLFFFGGLWLTVQRIPMASRPALLALGSFWGRAAVCVAGFYLVMDGHWARLVVCLLGFLVVRFVLVRCWQLSHLAVATTPRGERR